jgi:hypothetical protein
VFEFNAEFFSEVSAAAKAMKPIPNSFFCVEKSKELAIQKFREKLQHRRAESPRDRLLYMGACMPTCFQTLRGRSDSSVEHSDSLFIVHSCPEKAFRHAVEILRAGHYVYQHQVIPVMQIYEMRLHAPMLHDKGNNRLGCIIVDWEVKESEVAGRLDRGQLAALCEEFPLWLYQQMHRRKHVEHRAVVTAAVKQKTRDLPGGDRKHSIHATFNVCSVPATDLYQILLDCITDSRQDLKNFKSKDPAVRAKAFVDQETGVDAIADHPELGFDEAGITGNTGVAMLFSRKRSDDPYPGLAYTRAFSEGCEHVFPQRLGVPTAPNPEPFPYLSPDGQHDLARLTDDQAVYLMYMASCSAARAGMVAPTAHSCERAQVQRIRTAARLPATSGSAPPQGGGASSVLQLLPTWFKEHVSKRPGQENVKAALCFAHSLKSLCVHGADPDLWHFTRYQHGAPCPVMLSDPEKPTAHYHHSNGIILAYNEALPDFVFTRCTHCAGPSETNPDVERVRSKDGRASKWLKLWEQGFKSVMDKAQTKTMQKVKADKMVSKRQKEFEEKEQMLLAAKRKK